MKAPILIASTVLLFGCREFKLGAPALYPASHSCQAAEECESGLCAATAEGDAGLASGVCCEKECAADESCTLPGFQGYCTPRPPGTACQAAAECPGNRCLHTLDGDGKPASFCCEAECAADQACDLPGHEGRCTPRPLGAKCSGKEQCPSGFCVDDVCCKTACTETCRTCSEGAVPGVCDLALANTDARKECGLCGACLRGLCGPAEAGTDPNKLCGDGRVCGPGQNCGLPANEPCTVDSDCAVGACTLARCLGVSTERILVEPMVAAPAELYVRGLAVDSKGQLAFALAELIEDRGLYYQYLRVPVRHATGAWTLPLDVPVAFQSQTITGPDLAAGVLFWNDRLYVALHQPPTGPAPRGLHGRLFSSAFQAGPPELLAPTAAAPMALALSVDGQNRPFATTYWWDRVSYTFQLQRREVHDGGAPAWTSLTPSPLTSPAFDLVMVGGRALLATYPGAGGKVELRWLDEDAPADAADVPASCDSPWDLYASAWHEPAGDGLVLTLPCYDTTTAIATWRPWLPEGQRWTFDTARFLIARGLDDAREPLLAALAPGSDPALLDAAVAWRGADASWSSKIVVPSRGGTYVTSVRGTVDGDGFPVLVVGSGTGGPSSLQTRLDLVRLRP